MTQFSTKTDTAVAQIRERISSGQFLPGQRLRVEELTRELGMSPTPIREALRLLQADHLVDQRPHHGVVVSAPSPAEAAEVYRLRALLEPLATELSVRQLSPAALEELEHLHREMSRAMRGKELEVVADCNHKWHLSLYAGAESPRLNDFIRQLWGTFPWRIVVLPNRSKIRLKEHGAIMTAVRAGDAELAAALMRAHILSGQDDEMASFALMVEQARAKDAKTK